MDKYLTFKKVSDQETELYIYGDIREKDFFEMIFGVDAELTNTKTLREALEKVDTPNLTVRINSYGGQVDQGLAIYSLLEDCKLNVKTIVDGFACSAASVIFMAGKERIVPENGLLMIHNAWTRAEGDSNAMKKVAEDLEKITQPSINIYAKKTKLSEDEIKQKMNEQTWITSQEAYEWGFSTTQTRENKANQALEADFIHNLVLENKNLKAKIAMYVEKEKNIMVKEDSMKSFFNTKK